MGPLSSFLQRPRRYAVASLLCSLSGFSFGVETSIIGPVTVMKNFQHAIGGSSNATIQGLIVSSLVLASAISSLFAGRLVDAVGRVRGICIGTFIFFIGAALQAGAVNLAVFIVGRVVEGIGEGLYVGPMIVYICEISPAKHRAALTTAPQVLHTLGLVVGFFTCYGTANIRSSSFSWRLPFLILAVYSLAFTGLAHFCLPSSPRWLTLKGRDAEAEAVWEYLEVDPEDREKTATAAAAAAEAQHDRVLATATTGDDDEDEKQRQGNGDEEERRQQQQQQQQHTDNGPPKAVIDKNQAVTVKEVFLSPETRPQMLFALFLMGMQQLSGIDGILFYAPLLFQQAGLSTEQSSFLASGVSGIVIFAVTIPATIYADRWTGRRPSLILGGLSMSILMFLIGALYAAAAAAPNGGVVSSTSSPSPGNWVVIVAIYLYIVIYCSTWNVHIKVFAAEIQPKRTRATVTGMAYFSYSCTNFTVALITPILIDATEFGAYFLFGACLLLTAGVCLVFMPETRNRSLDELEDFFSSSSYTRRNKDGEKQGGGSFSRSWGWKEGPVSNV